MRNVGQIQYSIQTSPTRDRVWIHASDGSTVGRFGPFGVDLHTTTTEQMNGATECRFCTHGPVGEEHWQMFRQKAKEFWGVNVPKHAINTKMFVRTGSSLRPKP